MPDSIRITGARQHNLKNIDVEIPRDKLTVITGVSGSGKSSLAFDTLYAEGQRRYVESLSTYARQFLDRLEKPDVDFIEGLSPAISIEQRTSAPNPRSTVATSTEIYDYARLLFAAAGQPHDPETGAPVNRHTVPGIAAEIMALPERTRVVLLAPALRGFSGGLKIHLERLQKAGFVRVRAAGQLTDIDSLLAAKPKPVEEFDLDVVVDRLVVREGFGSRLHDSLTTAFDASRNSQDIIVLTQPGDTEDRDSWDERAFTTAFANPETGFRMPEITPRLFSFNSVEGACERCHGLGSVLEAEPALFISDPEKSLAQGTVRLWWKKGTKAHTILQQSVKTLAESVGAPLHAPFKNLPETFTNALFHGHPQSGFEGLAPAAARLHEESESETARRAVRRFLAPHTCPDCKGARLRPEALAVTVGGLGIAQVTALPVSEALEWAQNLTLTDSQKTVCTEVLAEVVRRIGFLDKVGLGYLTLDREAGTLSGGEAQRIRLASQIGGGLSGVLYVLDEPSIGLHQRDNDRLIETLKNLRDLGNTVVVVEHDEDTIRTADHLIDVGPGAGPHGGEIVAEGTPDEVEQNPDSPTGRFLKGTHQIPVPKKRTTPTAKKENWPTVHDATANNLQSVTAAFPPGCLTCVTGPSGSGKSTLVDTVFKRALFRHFHRAKEMPGAHRALTGLDHYERAVVVDQSPIGRSPRSNPATYVGAFDHIRTLYATLPASKVRGYGAGHFSFNVPGGRCETCKGDGHIKIDMHFLSDVYVPCEACHGSRFNSETLEATFKGKSIADVLSFTIEEGARFFGPVPKIAEKLRLLCEVGLGYLHLGQPGTTLSGGEAQRVKLAAELSKTSQGQTLYLLDEPTTGLHFADIQTLLTVLYRLRDAGNTLIVIEHNLDVIKCADHVIDLGPGGGRHGGHITAEGTPEIVAKAIKSPTGPYLQKIFKPR